ncbi:unnamed protein product, partial [marine sediment metagenome]
SIFNMGKGTIKVGDLEEIKFTNMEVILPLEDIGITINPLSNITEEQMASIRDRLGEIFGRAVDNSLEVQRLDGIISSNSPDYSEISEVPVDHAGRPTYDWKEKIATPYDTPTDTFKKIGEGFSVLAENITELTSHIDECNKRLIIVESLLTLNDEKTLHNKEKIEVLVKEVKRQIDLYIEEEMDAHLISRKIRWKMRCNRENENNGE